MINHHFYHKWAMMLFSIYLYCYYLRRAMWLTCEKDANQSRTFNLMEGSIRHGLWVISPGNTYGLQLGSLTQIYSKIQSKKNMRFPKPLNASRYIKTYWHSNIEAFSKSKNEIGIQSANSQIFTKQYRPANCHTCAIVDDFSWETMLVCHLCINLLKSVWLNLVGYRSRRNHEWTV